MICMNDLHALYGPICTYDSVKLLHFVSFLADILSMSYFILSSFCVHISPPVESVYWFHTVIFLSHIVFPLLCRVLLKWIFCSTVNSIHLKLCSVWSVWTLTCTFLVSLAGVAISRQKFGEQIRFDRDT